MPLTHFGLNIAFSLWLVSAGVLGLVFLIIWMVQQWRENRSIVQGLNLITLRCKLPVRIASPDEAGRRLEELLNLVHAFFVHSMKLRDLVYGRPTLSFELAIARESLDFYLQVPRHWEDQLRRHIYSSFPEATVRSIGAVQYFSPGKFGEVSSFKSMTQVLPSLKEMKVEWVKAARAILTKKGAKGAKIVVQAVASALPESWNLRALQGSSSLDRASAMAVRHKASLLNFGVNLRVMTVANSRSQAERLHQQVMKSLRNNLSADDNLSFYDEYYQEKSLFDFLYRVFNPGEQIVLSTRELASAWPFGLIDDIPHPTVQKISFQAAPNLELSSGEVFLDEFSKAPTRQFHFYVIGGTGTGKTSLLANLAIRDIQAGLGVSVIDPHGDLINKIINNIPKDRFEDVIYFDPFYPEHRLGINLLEVSQESQKHMQVQEMVGIFEKLFPQELIGPVFEHNMRNLFLTLMADKQEPGTLVEVPRMLTDENFARRYIQRLQDPLVKDFWEKERGMLSAFHKSESLQYLISKLGRFIEDPIMRQVLGSRHSSFSFNEVIADKKILLANLSKGRLGELNSQLLGLILVSKLRVAAFRQPLSNPQLHHLYVDEFFNFVTATFSSALAESRKFGLRFNLAHQFLGQLDPATIQSIFSNVGTIASFRVGLEDAEKLKKVFLGKVQISTLVGLDNYEAVVRSLDKDNKPILFVVRTTPPPAGDEVVGRAVKRLSALRFQRLPRPHQQPYYEASTLSQISPSKF